MAFEYLAERAAGDRLAVVLDEFPYLVESDPALPSVLQRFWDQRGKRSRLQLILCGSAQSIMLKLQSENAPLFGRVDARLHVRPFGYAQAGLFVPDIPPAERAIAYAVLGGMPSYLARWGREGHVANLRRLFGDATSPLVEEGEFVLASELQDAAGYFRIMHAIASGHRTFNAMRDFASIDISRQLGRLIDLGLVEREAPATEDPERSRRVLHRISDNFLGFWFRFVYRRRADIARGLGRQIVDREILPRLSDHVGEPWEEMCRTFVRALAAEGKLAVPVTSVGRWWNRDNSVEIDVVGVQGKTVTLAGSVKWSAGAGKPELHRLRRAVEAIPDRAPEVRLVLFARDQVRDVGPEEALTFTAKDLYEEA